MAGETVKSLTAYAKEIGKGGVAGAAAIYVNDRFIAAPLNGVIGQVGGGALGQWADAVEGFVVAVGIKYLTKNAKGAWHQAGHDAAVSLFAHKLASAFAGGPLDPPSPPHGAGTLAQPTRWQSLSSVPIPQNLL